MMPPSSSIYSSKLDLRDAVDIRRAHAAGATTRELARAYGLSRSSLHAVLRGRAHACTVTVRLGDAVYLRLAELAASEGVPFEDIVSKFIVHALHMEAIT